MRFWITRLDGTIVAETTYEQKQKQNSTDESTISQEAELKNEELAKQVINHSRTLSLAVYKNELLYTQVNKMYCYYRPKYKLLFILLIQSQERSCFSVGKIEQIIEDVIVLYEDKITNINNTYKLPKILTNYQKQQLKKLRINIWKIVNKENNFKLFRSSSLREDSVNQNNFSSQIKKRRTEINQIDKRSFEISESPANFQRQTRKAVYRQRLKQVILILLGFTLIGLSTAIFFFSENNQILI